MRVQIERVIPGGFGLARDEGRTLFVERALPGEIVEVEITSKRGAVPVATIIEVIEPSPERVTPVCPHYDCCGGCDFQHASYPAQVEMKRAMLRDSLVRIGKLELPDEIEFIAAPAPYGYRARAEWHVQQSPPRLGYFSRHSHDLCDIETCPILDPVLESGLQQVRAALLDPNRDKVPPQVAAATDGNSLGLFPNVQDLSAAELTVEAAGETYLFDARCFFQANLALLPQLISEVTTHATISEFRQNESTVAIDLFAGVGLFSLPLARRFDTVYGVEDSDHAVGFARRNAQRAGLANVHFATSKVERWLGLHAKRLSLVDLIVVDPPRAGLTPVAMTRLRALHPLRLTYVSCDPATLARDLRTFFDEGYKLERVVGIDMFPQSAQVEAVAHLSLPLTG